MIKGHRATLLIITEFAYFPMTKRLKAPVISSEEEFRATITGIAQLQNQVLALCAKRDGAVQRVQAEFAERIDPVDDAIDAALSLVEKYADEHRAALLPKDRKSADTTLATFGSRTGNRTVKTTSKKIDEETVVAALKANHLGAYVRTVEAIAKEKILADVRYDEGVKADVLVSSNAALVVLAELGLKIAQSETFFVEPKAESGETLKPSQGVA